MRHDLSIEHAGPPEQRRGATGFALPGTLAVLLFSSVIVASLLGVTFATSRFGEDQMGRDVETRAADAAIQASIGRIARDPSAATGRLVDPAQMSLAEQDRARFCDWEPGPGETEADRPTMVVEANGETVEVTCEADAPDVYVPEEQVSDRVLVVGEYEGAPAGWADRRTATAWRFTSDPGNACLISDSNCFPWREATIAADTASMQTTPSVNSLITELSSPSTRVGIAHTGTSPLRFIGDVQAKHGAAVLRNERDCDPANPTNCPYNNVGPGMTASGSYVQGAEGPLAGVQLHPSQPEADLSRALDSCGVLRRPSANLVRPYQLRGAQVETLEGIDCDSAGARALDPITARLSRPREGSRVLQWGPGDVAGRLAPAPTNAAGATLSWTPACPTAAGGLNARLIRLAPGAYTKDRTEVLSQWFAACSNYVFHFQPGNYWFDVDRVGPLFADGGSQAPQRHALVIDNPNNRVVFGAPRGWTNYQTAQSAAQPLCNPDVSGVSITLSPRTSLVHRRGAVSVCGVPPSAPSAQPQATIWQDSAPDLGISERPVSAVGGSAGGPFRLPSFREIWNGIFFGQPINWFGQRSSQLHVIGNPSVPTNGVPFQVTGDCSYNVFGWFSVPGVACQGFISYAMPFSDPNATTVSDASLASAIVTITANSSNANYNAFGAGNAQTTVDVYLPERPDTLACSNTYDRVPDADNHPGPITLAYDLLNSRTGNCATVLRAPDIGRESIMRSVVVVTHRVSVPWVSSGFSLTVTDARVRTGWSPRPAGAVSCSVPTGGRLRNSCSAPESVLLPTAAQWSEVRINRQAVTVPAVRLFGVTIIPSWELRYWPAGDTTATYLLPQLDDRFNPNLATEPDQTLTSAGVMVEGRSRCSIIGINCGEYSVANRDNANVVVRLLNPNGTNYCQASYRRLPEWGETRYLDLLAPAGGNIEQNSCAGTLAGRRNGDLLGKTLRVDLNLKPKVPCLPPSNNSGILDILASVGTGSGLLCSWWGYDVGRIELTTSSAVGATASATGLFPGPRVPMLVTTDSSAAARASFTMFGPLSMPANDLDVHWAGTAAQNTFFSGYPQNEGNAVTTMVVRGIGSDTRASDPAVTPNPLTRVLCCASGEPGERLVELRAWVGRPAGSDFEAEHLRTTARIRIVDRVPIPGDDDPQPGPTDPQPGTFRVAHRVNVEDWKVCTRGEADLLCRVT